MRVRPGSCVVVLLLCALAFAGCRRGPYLPDGGVGPADAGDIVDTGTPGPVDSGEPPPVDAGEPDPDPVDAGEPPPVDAGPVEDAGGPPPPPVDASPAGEAVRVGFINQELTVQAGECSGAYPEVPRVQVAILDGPGNPFQATQDTLVTLSSSSGTMRFHTDTACMQNAGQFYIEAGQTWVSLTVKDTNGGDHEIHASSPGLQAGTQTIHVLE